MSRKLLATIAASLMIVSIGPLAKASAQTTTLYPKQMIVSMGSTSFGAGIPTNAGVEPLTSNGIEMGLNETLTLDHYTIPLGAKVVSATVFISGDAGKGTLQASIMEVSREGQTHARADITGPRSTATTWVMPTEWLASYPGHTY